MTPLSIRLSPELFDWLQRRSQELGMTPDELVADNLEEQRRAESERKHAELKGLIDEAFESGPPISISREEMKAKMRERMAQLRAQVERGERPAPGGPGSIPA